MMTNAVEYYCVGVCAADAVTGLCRGCGRPMQAPALSAGGREAKSPDGETTQRAPGGNADVLYGRKP